MTFNYTNLRDNTAERLLARFGRSATLKQAGATTGDDWDPTPGTPTSYPVTISETGFTQSDRASTVLQEDDVKLILSTDGAPAPKQGDILVDGSDTYQLVKADRLKPGGTVVLYYIYCRR